MLASERDGGLRLLETFMVVHVSLVSATTALLIVERMPLPGLNCEHVPAAMSKSHNRLADEIIYMNT